MRTLFISPTYRCNEKCVFCPCSVDAKSYRSLTLEDAIEAVERSVHDSNVEMVLISGGEPTLWPQLPDFITALKNKHLRWGMLSNSTTFSSNTFLNRFLEFAGCDFELTTAFHSHIASEHDRITQFSGSFKKSLLGVLNLIERGVNVTIKHVINNLTYCKLPVYARWFCETFPSNVPWVICNMDICGVAECNRELTGVPFCDSKPYLEEALDIVSSENRGRVVRIFNTPLCCIDPYYWRFLQKYKSEEEMAALALPYQSDDTFEVKFNLKGDGGANFPPCENCKVRPICPGTWKNTAQVLGYNSFTPL